MKTNQQLTAEISSALNEAKTMQELDERKNRLAKELMTDLQLQLKTASAEEKRDLGIALSFVKNTLGEQYAASRKRLMEQEFDQEINRVRINAMTPAAIMRRGTRHILSQTAQDIADFFRQMGFKAVMGEEIVSQEFNFTRLNIPESHPARTSHDSFFAGTEKMLRTHVTSATARQLQELNSQSDIRVVSLGRVYRKDEDDATHSHQFMQLDLAWVSENVSLANLKWILLQLCRHLFGQQREIRLRPSYFPFTEPSYEVDVSCFLCSGTGCHVCKQTGWIEILGCGLLHENVLTAAGIDPQKYTGLAAGMGIERIAMLRHRIEDIRNFYTNDVRFLSQFKEK